MTDRKRFEDIDNTAEGRRMAGGGAAWRRWGPYVSERQWGTVREDYSPDGKVWAYFPHDHARSRAYRWGEDGIGGFSDDQSLLCLSLGLWNGRDPILKERFFGLSNTEGNHGEDVKELYYYLDGVPSHAYLRMLYKYPQAAFPYAQLVRTNAARGLHEREYELIDTGVFDDDRYFDVEIEYAKAEADVIVMLVTATNRGPDRASLHLLPQLTARNTWGREMNAVKPVFSTDSSSAVRLQHPAMAPMGLHLEGSPELLFCDNETNPRRFGEAAAAGYFKDAIHQWLVEADQHAVNPERRGTKLAAHYAFELESGASATVCLLLAPAATALPSTPWREIVTQRRAEADAYHAALHSHIADEDARRVHRQAVAGALWSKQFYYFEVYDWLQGDPGEPAPPASRWEGRDKEWTHLSCATVIAMPDKWEYPWFAAWDLAIHCVIHARTDLVFAKEQLELLTRARLMHPNGQLPAYEDEFGEANPPLHAWAAIEIYEFEKQRNGTGDVQFLERMFQKLALNFMWWVNRQDGQGRNIFEGGFLGMDNIGPFDRDSALPDGGSVDQSDGTAWVAAYALDLMCIALELARRNNAYEELAIKFFEHFLLISKAMHQTTGLGETGLWDEADGFYYDVLRLPNQPDQKMRIRSMVGLIPLVAVQILHEEMLEAHPHFRDRLGWFLERRPDLAKLVGRFDTPGSDGCRLLALMRREHLERVLPRLFDEREFLSAFGLRALSKYHAEHPAKISCDGKTLVVDYVPAESTVADFGGNSNWRGPVWMPLNLLIIRALQRYHSFYGDDFKVEFPTRSGVWVNLAQAADRLADRLLALYLRDPDGRRPFLGDDERQQGDPRFSDNLLFHEYFDGDTGRGCGASHQTGWTAALALLLDRLPAEGGADGRHS